MCSIFKWFRCFAAINNPLKMVVTKHNEKFPGVRRSTRLKKKAIPIQASTIGPSLSSLRLIFTPDRQKKGILFDGLVEMGGCLATSTPKSNQLESSRVKQIQDQIKEKISKGSSRPVSEQKKKSAKSSAESEEKLTNVEIDTSQTQKKEKVTSSDKDFCPEVDQAPPCQNSSSLNTSSNLTKKPRKYPKKKRNARSQLTTMKRVEDKVLQQFRPASRTQINKLSPSKSIKKIPVAPKQLAIPPPKASPKAPPKPPKAAPKIPPKVSPKSSAKVPPNVPKAPLKVPNVAPAIRQPNSSNTATIKPSQLADRLPLATAVPAREPIAYRDPNIPSSPIPSLPIPKNSKPTYLELLRKCAPGPDPMNLLRPPKHCCCSHVRPGHRIQTPVK